MPNLANAKKALRQSDKRAQRNKIAKAELKSVSVKLRKLIASASVKEAEEVAKLLGKMLDKAQAKKVLKKNTVARKKSRFMKKLNVIKKA